MNKSRNTSTVVENLPTWQIWLTLPQTINLCG
jgi:hypothetical protein